MYSRTRAIFLAIVFAMSAFGINLFAEAEPEGQIVKLPKGQITLPAGYQHEQLQGIDSLPGRIVKEGGLQISYDIGGIPKPGAPRLGGQFTDYPKNMPKSQQKWYKERTVAKQPVHMALTNDNRLHVSFPLSGINFSVEANTREKTDEALSIILSYRDQAITK